MTGNDLTRCEKREIRGKRSARYQVRGARMRNLYGGESHFQHYRTPRQLLEEASCRPESPAFKMMESRARARAFVR